MFSDQQCEIEERMLTYDQARFCYESIRNAELPQNILPLRRDVFVKAVEYAQIRVLWQLSSREQRDAMDQRRTIAHNAFIDACNILSRNMVAAGGDNSWRAELGDDRKTIGDFACYVHCFLGIEGR